MMEAERWRLLEDIYHSALEREENDRTSFLKNACNGDDDLLRDIESLLACDKKAETFLESPALQVAAQLLSKQDIEQESPAPLSPGTIISHYRILEKIGAGGMGEVYRAHDPRLSRDVAIKILPGAFASDPDRQRRFEQEARAAAALNHPNIVAIYDVGRWEYGSPYVVSELLQGETLRSCLERGALPIRKAIDIATQICCGLAIAHGKGIIHRDLKPENIWLTKEGHVKILDFGLAKLLPEKVETPELDTVTNTTSTKLMGTIGYMSPEQLRGVALDHRTDIFSLGAVMYELLSGRRAFHGTTPADTISAILSRDPIELTAANHEVPVSVSGIVRRSLEKNPDDRFQSARDVSSALGAVPGITGPDSVRGVLPFTRWGFVPALFLLALAVLWLWDPGSIRQAFTRRPAAGSIRSLAVLPLEDLSGTAGQEYFADGMTDELITELGGMRDVRVISRNSVMHLRASKQTLSEIGAMLNVDAVVEGTVLRQGNRVRITAQLLDVPGDRQLWAHSYEGDLADVLYLQAEIARSVTNQVKAKLGREYQQKLDSAQPQISAAAYDAYLKGIYFSAKLTPEDMQKGFGYLNDSTQLDPGFAPAYAGMAEAYSWAAGLSLLPPADALQKAESTATRALQIDPELGTAHHALAWVNYARKWDFASAESEFQRAIELSPNNATAHLWYGMYLSQRKRTDEAFAEMQIAKQLDPLSSLVHSLAMTPLLAARQYDRIIDEVTQSLKSAPGDGALNWLLTEAYERKGDLGRAIDQQEKLAVMYGESPSKAKPEFAAVRKQLAEKGERAYWISRERALSTSPWADPYELAVVQARLTKSDAMYASLKKAFEQRSTSMVYWIQTEPAFDRYVGDTAFTSMLQHMTSPAGR